MEKKSILHRLLESGAASNATSEPSESTWESDRKAVRRKSTSDLIVAEQDSGDVVEGSSVTAERRSASEEDRSASEVDTDAGGGRRTAGGREGRETAATSEPAVDIEGEKRTAELERVVQEVDWSDTEMVHVVIKPWVRVDGSLNRRVLDRLLGSVLGHCLCQPCVSVRQTMDRFSPALQPFQTRQLVEILQKLGCLTLQVVRRGWKTDLFSKVSPVWLEEADGTEDESQMVIRPAVDAIMRLGTFIGDKAYKKDFLS